MPSDTSRARLRRFAGYTAFTIFSLFLFLWLTFPYEVVERTVLQQAQAAGLDLRIGSTGPGFFGVRFSKLQLLPKPEPGQDPDRAKALVIDSLSVRPSLFPIGVHLSADALGGDVSGSYGHPRESEPARVARRALDAAGELQGLHRDRHGRL